MACNCGCNGRDADAVTGDEPGADAATCTCGCNDPGAEGTGCSCGCGSPAEERQPAEVAG